MPKQTVKRISTSDAEAWKRLELFLGGAIRVARQSQGLTQQELANRIEKLEGKIEPDAQPSQSFISKVENGIIKPSISNLALLCCGLEKSPAFIMEVAEFLASPVNDVDSKDVMAAIQRRRKQRNG